MIIWSRLKVRRVIRSHPHKDIRKSWLCAARSKRCDPSQVPPTVLKCQKLQNNIFWDIGQRSWTHPQVALQRAAAVSLRCHCHQNSWLRRLRKWFGLKKIPRRRKNIWNGDVEEVLPHKCQSGAPPSLDQHKDDQALFWSRTKKQTIYKLFPHIESDI